MVPRLGYCSAVQNELNLFRCDEDLLAFYQRQNLSSINRRPLAMGALAWIWGRSPLTIPIPGFKNVQQAQENARAMAFGPLTPGQMQEIELILG